MFADYDNDNYRLTKINRSYITSIKYKRYFHKQFLIIKEYVWISVQRYCPDN